MQEKRKFLSLAAFFFVYFCIIHACEKYSFIKEKDIELKDHVITTITTPYVEICWDKCVWIMNCFSINVRVNGFGMVECDLNNSSKKASPGSLVSTQGSHYHQMGDINKSECEKYECKRKEALPDGWYRVNDRTLKMISENKTWLDARAHCQSLGGELVSIATADQNDFIYNVLVKGIETTKKNSTDCTSLPGIAAYWTLDGTDLDVRLIGDPGDARYESVNEEKTLYLRGFKGYGKVPAVAFNPEGYTIMIWVKPANQSKVRGSIYNDWHRPNNFEMCVKPDFSAILFQFMSENGTYHSIYQKKSNLFKEWTHVAYSWNKTKREIKLVLDGKDEKGKALSNVTGVRHTSHSSFYIGARGGDPSNVEDPFHGHMKHLMVFNKALDMKDIHSAIYCTMQGHWIGLGSRNSSVFQWSDGTEWKYDYVFRPLYFNLSYRAQMCVAFGAEGKWIEKPCNQKRSFICKKKCPKGL